MTMRGSIVRLLTAGTILGMAGAAAGQQTYTYGGPPVPIPDGVDPGTCATNPGADAVVPINVPDSFTLTDVSVAWYIQHTWQADLQIYLRHGATTVLLVDRPGSDGTVCGFANDNYGLNATTLFQVISTAPFVYDTGSPGAPADNVIGPWLPENPYTPFIGTNSQGMWELVAHDCAGLDTGTIIAISLTLTGGSGSTCYPNCDGSTTQPCLNVADFGCFLNRFAASDTYANCDGSTTIPVLNVADFGCFINTFAAGCSAC
jgi:subtilisin-like proprotein convertase family protein